MMIEEAILGNVRSGKTFLLVNRLYDLHLKMPNKPVVTNFYTTFSRVLNPEEMLNFELEHAILGITEAYGIMDSSNRGKASEYLSYFIFQSGKRDVDFYYDAQLGHTIGDRLRELAVKETQCRNTGTREKPNFEYLTIDKSLGTYEEFTIPFEIAQPYFCLYDTYEIVMPLYVSSKSMINIDDLMTLFEESENKKTFTVLIREKNPYITWEKAGAVYTLLEAGKKDKVIKLLRL